MSGHVALSGPEPHSEVPGGTRPKDFRFNETLAHSSRCPAPANTAITSDTETQNEWRAHLSQHGLSTGAPLLHSGNPSVRLVHRIVMRPATLAPMSVLT